MPAKNSVKQFVENSYYHIYNRGVEKRTIFSDEKDYAVFMSYLKNYLLPKDKSALQQVLSNQNSTSHQKAEALKLLRMNNFSDLIDLIAHCLMPNHFHLLVKQSLANGIDLFMNSLTTRYSMYFNKRNKRVGHLFQGTYKAVLVESEEQLIHLTGYIHCNPALKGDPLRSYKYSSYGHYLGLNKIGWVKSSKILALFAPSGPNSYEAFVEYISDYDSVERIAQLAIDIEG